MNITDLGGGRGWLDYNAALSLWRLDARLGRLWQISEAGRTWAQQNAFRQAYLNGVPGAAFALPAGTSIHEQGRAIDTNDRIVWLLNENGWFQTALAVGEGWHFEYDISRDQYAGTTSGGGSTAFPFPQSQSEEDDMPTSEEIVHAFLNWPAYTGGPTISEFFKAVDQGGVATQVWNRVVDRGVDENGNRVLISALQELADIKTIAMREAIETLSSEDLERIAQAVNDERDARNETAPEVVTPPKA